MGHSERKSCRRIGSCASRKDGFGTATPPAPHTPSLVVVVVEKAAGKGCPWKGSWSLTQHPPKAQGKVVMTARPSPPPPSPLPGSFDSSRCSPSGLTFTGLTQNPPACGGSLEDLQLSGRNTLPSAPPYRKTEVRVYRTATMTQNIWGLILFFLT